MLCVLFITTYCSTLWPTHRVWPEFGHSRGGHAVGARSWPAPRCRPWSRPSLAPASMRCATASGSKVRACPRRCTQPRPESVTGTTLLARTAGETEERYKAFLKLWERIELDDLSGAPAGASTRPLTPETSAHLWAAAPAGSAGFFFWQRQAFDLLHKHFDDIGARPARPLRRASRPPAILAPPAAATALTRLWLLCARRSRGLLRVLQARRDGLEGHPRHVQPFRARVRRLLQGARLAARTTAPLRSSGGGQYGERGLRGMRACAACFRRARSRCRWPT